jgi:hypothetical protein
MPLSTSAALGRDADRRSRPPISVISDNLHRP